MMVLKIMRDVYIFEGVEYSRDELICKYPHLEDYESIDNLIVISLI